MLQQTASAETPVTPSLEGAPAGIASPQRTDDEAMPSTDENDETGREDGDEPEPADVDEPSAVDSKPDGKTPSTDEDELPSRLEPEDASPEKVGEEKEEIVLRLRSSTPAQTDVKDELRAFEERLETAERRVAELEQRLSLMEEDMEEVLAWQDELEESIGRLEDLEETVVEAEATRREATAARMARASSLQGIEQDLDNVLRMLERGSFDVDRQIGAASRGLTELARDAARHGHLVESERVDAAVQSLRLSQTALAHRDLYETRLAISMALTHVTAAHALARMEVAP